MRKRLKFNYRAVIFDMDGVITNTMPYHFDAWLSVFKSAGLKISCYEVYRREGQDGFSTIKEIFRKHNMSLSATKAKELLRRKEELFKKTVKLKFIKGSRPFVRELERRGLKLGLVTGTSRHEMERILPLAVRRRFDVIVTGDEVYKGKPHPEPFLKAVRALKARPEETMVIENAPFGIRSAKDAGLFCAALETSLPKKYLLAADAVFGSFDELDRAVFKQREQKE